MDPGIVPDLVFLDVRMPERDGFSLLESFDARGIHPFVIFVTAHSMYALNAYEAGVVDYLLKPFDDQRFAKALDRAKAALNGQRIARYGINDRDIGAAEQKPRSDRRLVTEDNRILLIPTPDIELIQVAGRREDGGHTGE